MFRTIVVKKDVGTVPRPPSAVPHFIMTKHALLAKAKATDEAEQDEQELDLRAEIARRGQSANPK